MLRITADPTATLSTIQVGITLIGIVAGAFGERALASDLAGWLAERPIVGGYAEIIAQIVVIGGITVVSLVVGELVPKRLALLRPEAIACAVALPLRVLSVAARPLVAMLALLTESVLWVLRARRARDEGVTEDDVRTALKEAAATGALADEERDIAERALVLGDVHLEDAMVPRHEVEWVDLDEGLEAALAVVSDSAHGRFPAARGSLDYVEGCIAARDVLRESMAAEPRPLADLLRPIQAVPESASLLSLLRALKQGASPLILAVDEHGQTAGIATPSDLVATVVADLSPILGRDEPTLVPRKDGTWLVDGDAAPEALEKALGRQDLAANWPEGVRTVAGLLLVELGRLGSIGDVVVWRGLRFEIVDTDGRRIDRVLVGAAEPEAT